MDPTQLSILRRVGGAALVSRLVGLFEATTRQKLDELTVAIAQGDRPRIVESAHYIKGGAASLGVLAVAEAAARLERRAAAGEVLGLAEPLLALRAQFQAGLDTLRHFSQDSGALD